MIHTIRRCTEEFNNIKDKNQNFAIINKEQNTYPFKVGDTVCVEEYDFMRSVYTGRKVERKIKYMGKEMFIKPGFFIVGF